MVNSSASLAIIISYPTSASEIIVLLKTLKNLIVSPRLNFVRTKCKKLIDKGLALFTCHMSIKTVNARTESPGLDEWKIKTLYRWTLLKTHRDSRILHSRTAKKTWQIMWRKRIFKWHLSKLPWIWIFGAVFGEVACYEVVWSHQLVLLNEKRSYTDASIAVVNGCIACILVTCDLYSSCRINKRQ